MELDLPIRYTKPISPNLEILHKYINEMVKSGWYANNGKFSRELISKLKSKLNVDNLILSSSCTSALRTILAIHKFNKDKTEIIVPSFTYVATISSIVACGYYPIFVDVKLEDGTINPDEVEKAISKNTFAILGVHAYGNPCDNLKLSKISKYYDIKLIYDSAHAFAVAKNNESILNWGDASVVSFHATKVFNTCEGGAIISRNRKLIDKSFIYLNHGIDNKNLIVSNGMNGKLSELNSIFGISIIDKIDNSILKRKYIYEKYLDSFKEINHKISPFLNFNNCRHNYAYAPFLIRDFKQRDLLYDYLKANKIISKKYFSPLVSEMEPYKKYKEFELNSSKKLSLGIICLPIFDTLDDINIEYIIMKVKKFFKK